MNCIFDFFVGFKPNEPSKPRVNIFVAVRPISFDVALLSTFSNVVD